MRLIPEATDFKEYLQELDVVDYNHPIIYQKIGEIFENQSSEIEKVKAAFLFVRDKISHSWDIQSTNITCKASEVLTYGEGICYAKANLLAGLLRGQEFQLVLLSTINALSYPRGRLLSPCFKWGLSQVFKSLDSFRCSWQ